MVSLGRMAVSASSALPVLGEGYSLVLTSQNCYISSIEPLSCNHTGIKIISNLHATINCMLSLNSIKVEADTGIFARHS